MADVSASIAALRENIAQHDGVLVAFSGGIDSTLVLKVANDVLGDRALGVLGQGPAVPPAEVESAVGLARVLGARLRVVPTHEIDDPNYASNPVDRCFHCKSELYSVCHHVAAEEGISTILNGTNADDPGDYRPGLRAAEAAEVRSPLLECGLHKQDVRAVAERLGVPNWNKPALACLASRLPHGTPVTIERLRSVDAVETQLRTMGFRDVRARHHGDVVKLEVDPERVAELEERFDEAELQAAVAEAGFQRATVTPGGYRTGRLNEESGIT